jgi:PTH1 family peptidyl-tRNA hydrolase
LKLIVGLGNPGPDYARTRHNLGFRVADGLAREWKAAFAVKKFGAEIAEANAGGESVWIMKPQTYMNHSGEAVGAAVRFLKLPLEALVVAHDDLELEPFRVQVKVGGGHGGHNGIRSVNAHLGSPEYARVRMGVGRPPPEVDPADWVLGRFAKADDEAVEECVALGVQAARAVAERGATMAMNEINRRR